MDKLRKLKSDFECTTLDNGLRQPETTWITFINEGWQEHWLPLTDFDGNPIFWSTDNMRIAKVIAHKKFPNTQWGLSNCRQKKIGNACVDNF